MTMPEPSSFSILRNYYSYSYFIFMRNMQSLGKQPTGVSARREGQFCCPLPPKLPAFLLIDRVAFRCVNSTD